ncbi:MAG: AraC family transcriptional regulator [Acutalibacteraceae bacterium]|nr:AraC family transcriptional regulator [Acutalibacteraceae bacterium]
MKEILKGYNCSGSPLKIQLIGISYCDASYHICRNNSQTTVIEYITSGEGYVTRGSKDCLVKKDEVYLLRQGENQNYYASAEKPFKKIFINVGGTLPLLLIKEYGLTDKWHFDGSGMKDLFLKVAEISKSQRIEEFEEERLEAIFYEMLARLSKKNKKTQMSAEAMLLKDYLDKNTNRIVSNKELADVIFRSTDYCVKLFLRELGTTPYNYQLESKIRIAKMLLRDTSLSVAEIAMRIGYSDNCYFSSLFKTKTSVTPREYRKRVLYNPKI